MGKIQIWVDTKNPKSNLNLTGRRYLKFFKKNLTGSTGSRSNKAVSHYLLKENAEMPTLSVKRKCSP